MKPFEFIAAFRVLHERAKKGALTPAERAQYATARTQFGTIVSISQQLGHAGVTLRANLRMATMLKVELRPDGGEPLRTNTIDLSSRGFAVLMNRSMKVGSGAAFTIHLPAQISGQCNVASSHPQSGSFRVSFKFEPLPPPAQESLDIALIDAVLSRFV